MRRKITIAALLTVGFLVAPSGAAQAGATVPFMGSDRGAFSIPGECPGGAQVVIGGVGTATGLGRYGYTAVECFDPVAGSFAGTATFVAADGDTITGTYAGTVGATADPNVVTYQEELTITGGTGRFSGASGSVHVDGLANLATGEYRQRLIGSISNPGGADA